MPSGRVDIRTRESSGKSRLRFYGLAKDQLATIVYALAVARGLGETEFDAVALELICMQFLATQAPQPSATLEGNDAGPSDAKYVDGGLQ
jgi:hypothetical protein